MPRHRTVVILVATLAILVSGCWSHSFPSATSFIRPAMADCVPSQDENCVSLQTVQVFADVNGTLFPSGWRSHPGLRQLRAAGSLFQATPPNSEARTFVEQDERRQLDELATLGDGEGPGRIFILVHGYNNRVFEAEQAFRMIEYRLNLRPADRVIRFYWDGHTGWGAGALRIWFWAAGNSQLVGSRALRNILRGFRNEEIYLIGHSRGTSVILSALSNPIYNPRFLEATHELARRWGVDPDLLLHPRPLEDANNRIHVLAAAPAVDRIDFCDASYQRDPDFQASGGSIWCQGNRLRSLGTQIQSFRNTVNARDPVLNKFIGLSRNFNPTRLGLHQCLGPELRRERYSFLEEYVISPAHPEHAFTWYVQQPQFERMLKDAGIASPALNPEARRPATVEYCDGASAAPSGSRRRA